MFKNRNLSKLEAALILILMLLTLYTGCGKATAFVVVRESDFRLGPVTLPLADTQKKEILVFLVKGGDHAQENIVEPKAKKKYKDLLELLSKKKFLVSSNFVKDGKIDNVSPKLEQWFGSPIVYQLIDATQKRPPVTNPLCMTDGKYWWVFYRWKEKGNDADYTITKLLITLRISKDLDQFGKEQ
ncbi:MAG: hypothetical protein GY950_05660 [bacterium]|nr:hypothetical protein [bacterium]